jgi:hypothetical protein
MHNLRTSLLFLTAIQAYRKQVHLERQLVGVFDAAVPCSRREHGKGRTIVQREPPSTAITASVSSASIPTASTGTRQTPSPLRIAQCSARFPPQARSCAFDHPPNKQRRNRADAACTTKQSPYSITRLATPPSTLHRQASERILEWLQSVSEQEEA